MGARVGGAGQARSTWRTQTGPAGGGSPASGRQCRCLLRELLANSAAAARAFCLCPLKDWINAVGRAIVRHSKSIMERDQARLMPWVQSHCWVPALPPPPLLLAQPLAACGRGARVMCTSACGLLRGKTRDGAMGPPHSAPPSPLFCGTDPPGPLSGLPACRAGGLHL